MLILKENEYIVENLFWGELQMEKFTNIVIGFGKGGKTLAKTLATNGQDVLLIEKSAHMYGGACINVACLPSKRLVLNAAAGLPFSQAVVAKNEMTSQLRQKNYHMVADEAQATVLDGTARFISDHVLEIALADGQTMQVEGQRIFINTGSKATMPEIEGLKESKYRLDSTTAMEQSERPNRLIVLGAGYIGLEFSSMFTKFGSQVTVIDRNQEFLKREDEDIAHALYEDLTADGIDFKLGAQVQAIIDHENEVEVVYEVAGQKQSVRADKFLVALGRQANTQDLGLENTGIATNPNGSVKVDDFLQTTVEGVWALGDVNGGLQFTYISLDDFRIVKDQLLGEGKRRLSDRTVVPYSVFTQTPLSNVGLTEKQAQAQGIDYQLFKLSAMAIPKAKVIGNQRGLLKALVNPKDDTILGASLYMEESYEVINLLALAIKAKIPYTQLRDQIYTHPTMSEALNDLFKAPVK